ncbi:hypothetical protein N9948_00790 [bacterium]|nr:hypothetical protein [bacterium]
MAGEQRAKVRLTFLLWDFTKGSFYQGIEVYDSEIFQLNFINQADDYLEHHFSDDVIENITNDLEIIKEKVEDKGFNTPGIYELWGEYAHEWECSHGYWGGGDEWDCHWDIVECEISKFNKFEVKKYLEKLYFEGNRNNIMSLIHNFGLVGELNTVRRDWGKLSDNCLFTYDSKSDNIDISLINL